MVTRGGSHGGVAKWDLRTQGGQVSRALITGLNADTASTSHQGGRNRYGPDSVQYDHDVHNYIVYKITAVYGDHMI